MIGHLKPKKGFTLIELLVVIAIIALLSTIAGVALNSARQKGRDAKRVADIRQIQTALELGFDSALDFPGHATSVALGATGFGKLCQDGDTATANNQYLFADACAAGTTVYMAKVSRDPSKTGGGVVCAAASTAVCDYAFKRPAALQYELMFYLEGGAGGLGAGLSCASEAGIVSGATCTH